MDMEEQGFKYKAAWSAYNKDIRIDAHRGTQRCLSAMAPCRWQKRPCACRHPGRRIVLCR
eukprot:366520-Chlamydomonas_euryale.AAC.7